MPYNLDVDVEGWTVAEVLFEIAVAAEYLRLWHATGQRHLVTLRY